MQTLSRKQHTAGGSLSAIMVHLYCHTQRVHATALCISASHHQHSMHCPVTQPQMNAKAHCNLSHMRAIITMNSSNIMLKCNVRGCRYECPVVLARNETAEEVAGLVGAQATSACWIGSQGICFALGYSTGDICVWGLPGPVQQGTHAFATTTPCTA